MPATEQDLIELLKELGIQIRTYRHPPVRTVGESQRQRGNIPGAHCKNLFLKDKRGAFFLVITLEDRKIDLKKLAALICGARLSFGRAEIMMDLLGVQPGAVSPFALINKSASNVQVIIDQDLVSLEVLNFHPLTNEATTAIVPHDLINFVRACGHEPKIIEFGDLTDQ